MSRAVPMGMCLSVVGVQMTDVISSPSSSGTSSTAIERATSVMNYVKAPVQVHMLERPETP